MGGRGDERLFAQALRLVCVGGGGGGVRFPAYEDLKAAPTDY